MIKRLRANALGRDFVVGDLHGSIAEFRRLLSMMHFDPKVDRMFSVGDLADRGVDSVACMALLKEPWFHAVIGNHEMILVAVLTQGEPLDWWIRNGGRWALSLQLGELHELVDAIKKLPFVIVVGNGDQRFNIIHAEFFGSDRDLDTGKLTPEILESMLWGRTLIRGEADPEKQAGLSPTYCGHTIRSQVCRVGSQIFIDTGAFLGAPEGRLTIIEPATGKTWSTSSADIFPTEAA